MALPSAHCLSPRAKKIPFHRQLADLGMKITEFGFMVPAGTLGAVRKHLSKAANRLTFPRAYLVRMHLVRGRDLLHRPVAPLRFQRHPGLEISREPASFRHLHIPPQGAEYTLTHCPVFWGHLR